MRRLLLVLLCTACASAPEPSVISDDVFVRTLVDLRQAAWQTPDPGAYLASRDQVLRSHGVTEDDLREFLRVHGSDLQHLARVWTAVNDSVTARLNAL